MKSLRWLMCCSMAILVLTSGVALAGDEEVMDEAAMMEAWQKAMTPGEPHQWMADLAGNWTVTSTSYMNPESPMKSTGTCERTMLLGGRFMMEKVSSNMMGMPMEGIGINGYNNTTGMYEFVWMDNFGTMIMTGTGMKEGKVLTMTSEYVDPITGKKSTAKMVTTMVDDDHQNFAMYEMKGGKEVKMMEAEYMRAKEGSE